RFFDWPSIRMGASKNPALGPSSQRLSTAEGLVKLGSSAPGPRIAKALDSSFRWNDESWRVFRSSRADRASSMEALRNLAGDDNQMLAMGFHMHVRQAVEEGDEGGYVVRIERTADGQRGNAWVAHADLQVVVAVKLCCHGGDGLILEGDVALGPGRGPLHVDRALRFHLARGSDTCLVTGREIDNGTTLRR